MKLPIRSLPILLLIVAVAVLYGQRQTVASPSIAEGGSDIRTLQEQREHINAEIDLLEDRPKNFVPRGIGRAADNFVPVPSQAKPADSPNN